MTTYTHVWQCTANHTSLVTDERAMQLKAIGESVWRLDNPVRRSDDEEAPEEQEAVEV